VFQTVQNNINCLLWAKNVFMNIFLKSDINLWFSSIKWLILAITHLSKDSFWPSSCINLFHTLVLKGFMVIFWYKYSLMYSFLSWIAHLLEKKISGRKLPLWSTYTCQRKIELRNDSLKEFVVWMQIIAPSKCLSK